jgi:hypothetical protein
LETRSLLRRPAPLLQSAQQQQQQRRQQRLPYGRLSPL